MSHDYSFAELNFKIIPLAAESLGVRSMCTYVETPDLCILIDPGVSLGPRFGLLPHPKEYEAIREARKQLAQHAEQATVVTNSHYHYDHATPTYTDYLWNLSDLDVAKQIYKDKVILAKDYRDMVNPSQRRRGWMLKDRIERGVKSLEPADGRAFTFGDTILRFSQPVPHGEQSTSLGWVLMLSIEHDGDVFVHASDVQGPMVDETVGLLLKNKPSLVYLGGPPTYLLEYRLRNDVVCRAFENLSQIVEKVPTVILDHHLLREGSWPKGFERILALSKEKGHHLLTVAEFMHVPNSFLESRRKELYNDYPPSEEFIRWSKLSEKTRMRSAPPL
ncbi:MBL fold metallo-hydrolase [Candidatus Bathyarchaeota archaeon]|nr:MBL fold metallo-hydrolase [Candidatus Bathyarchaeota archaeon]